MKKFNVNRCITALTVILIASSAKAELIIEGDSLGVLVQDENLDTFIGRTHIINGIAFIPQDGQLTLNSYGGQTSLTNRNINIGTSYGSEGIVNVIGETAVLNATDSITLSGDEYRGFEGNGTDVGGGQLNVLDGAEVNADSIQGGTRFNSSEFSNSDAPFEATITVDGQGSTINVGSIGLGNEFGASGLLSVINGGHVKVEASDFETGIPDLLMDISGIGLSGNSVINVDGEGSLLEASNLHSSVSPFPQNFDVLTDTSGNFSIINIANGGSIILRDPLVGLPDNSPLTDSQTSTTSRIGDGYNAGVFVDGANSSFQILEAAESDLYIGTHGLVVNDDNTEGKFVAGNGVLDISNSAIVDVAGDVYLGGFDNGYNVADLAFFGIPSDREDVQALSTGLLNLNSGGSLTASTVFVRDGGVISGSDGIINGDVEINGGVVAPGNSPGNIFIDGDFTLNYGVLDLEYFGSDASERDILDITGNVFFGDDALISILFGFAPPVEFSLESFINTSNLSFGNDFNFADNFYFQFSDTANVSAGDSFFFSFGGQRNLFTVPGGVVDVNAPSILMIFATALFGILTFRNKRKVIVVG